MQKNFNNQKTNLSKSDINELVDIIGNRCSYQTKRRIESVLTYGISTIGNFGILDRLIYENFKWSYCAGQSYPDEIRLIRRLILTGK